MCFLRERNAFRFPALRLREKLAFDMLGKSAPGRAWYSCSGFCGSAGNCLVRRRSRNQPGVHVQFKQYRAQPIQFGEVRVFANERMDGREKTGEPRGAESLDGETSFGRLDGVQANDKKEMRHGLKFMNATAQKMSVGLEKNVVAARRHGADKMRNPRMIQRLTSPNPNHGSRTGKDAADFFVNNRMIGSRMQDLGRIGKSEHLAMVRRPKNSLSSGFR